MFKNRLVELVVLGICLTVISWLMIIWLEGCGHRLVQMDPTAPRITIFCAGGKA